MKTKLKNKTVTIGSWLSIGHPTVTELMADAGFEWLVLDNEHTSMSSETIQRNLEQIQGRGIKALVRVERNDEVPIKKVLDGGADGIIVPMIKTREDALKAVDYCYYPPHGKRGVGLFRAQKYGFGFNEYVEWQKENLVLIAQIEHIDAVHNLEEILSVPEIDGIIIGPYDLSASMGMPGQYNNEEVKAAIKKVEEVTLKSGKSLGFHIIEPDAQLVQEKIAAGFNLIAFSIDFLFLAHSARGQMAKVKEMVKGR